MIHAGLGEVASQLRPPFVEPRTPESSPPGFRGHGLRTWKHLFHIPQMQNLPSIRQAMFDVVVTEFGQAARGSFDENPKR